MIGTAVAKERLIDLSIRRPAIPALKPYLVRSKSPLLTKYGNKPYAFFFERSLPLQSSFASLSMRSESPFASPEAQSSLASDQPFRGTGTGNVANEGIELGIQTIQRTTEAATEVGPGISSVVECTPAVVESSVSSCASIFSSFASCLGCLGC